MFKILNRISIALSIVLAFCITIFLTIYLWWIKYIWKEEIIILILLTALFSSIIKSVFFSKSFITQRLEFFYEAIKKRESSNYKKIEEKDISDIKETNKTKIKNKENNLIKQAEHKTTKQKKDKTNHLIKLLKDIFGKNLLAKIWVILVFLWVVFLLALVWNQIPSLIKLVLWFFVGFSTYFAWVALDKKWIKQESKLLIWTWILINFLVILWWKFILEWSDFDQNYLSTISTFVLLILNTLFAIVTGLYYKSNFIIYLSFLFAFINPFLTWWDSQTPYVLLVYSIIVSIWTIVVWLINKNNILIVSWFILSSIIYFVAPFDSELWLITKVFVSLLSWLAYILSLKRNDFKKLNIIFFILWIFITFNSIYLVDSFESIKNITLIIISAILIWYLLINYIFSINEKYSQLYSVWSIFTILSITFLLFTKQDANATIISIIVLVWLIVTVFPFFNKNVLWENNSLTNINIWNIVWIIFLWWFLFRYWSETIPWLTLWFAFVWLAIYYFLLWIIITYKFPIEKTINIEKIKNNLYSYFAISIALFTLSVALIFEESNIIISIIWLIEASVLFFMYNKTSKQKIFYIALIIFFIWILKMFEYSLDIIRWNYYSLISIFTITALLAFNIRNTTYKQDITNKNIFHDIIHILWIIWTIFLVKNVVDIEWLNILLTSIIIAFMWWIYAYYGTNLIKIFYIIWIALFASSHIEYFDYLTRTNNDDLLYLHYITTLLLALGVYLYNRLNIVRIQKILLNIVFLLYSLIIVSMYIYNYFQDTFAVTIFWWVISILFIARWISNNKIKYRTLGLYLLTLVILKVFLFDIWYSIEDAISRVIVFIVLWILLIIVSIKYSKKYWDNLIWEFNIKNFNKVDIIHEVKDEESDEIIIDKQKITSQIKKIDISDIESASFKINWKTEFTTKSKNLLQITKYVINKTWKLEYEGWELTDFYDFLITNYITELNSRDLKKVKEAFKVFVDKWWEVIIK